MRTSLVVAMVWLATACGGGDDSPGKPYSGSSQCGDPPTGVWQLHVTSATRGRPGQTAKVCDSLIDNSFDFAQAIYTNVYDSGCRLQCTADYQAEEVHLEMVWVGPDEWSGTMSDTNSQCEALADATLTRQ